MHTSFLRFLSRIAYAPDTEGAGGDGGEVATLASVEDRADHILGLLGDDDDGAAASEIPANAANTAPEKASGDDSTKTETEVETAEPEAPAIEPPPTWKAELKAKWSELPRDLQQTLAQWETERNTGFNAKLNEAAETRKAAEAAMQAAQAERQRYAQALEPIIQAAQADDPVLIQGMRTDWARLAQEDPVAFVQQRAAFEQASARRQHLMAEYQAVQERQRADYLASQQQALTDKLPDWGDKAKRQDLAKGIADYLVEKGFSQEEIKQATDHRALLVAHEVLQLRRENAELRAKAQKPAEIKKEVQTKKVAELPKVQKPGAVVDGSSNARVDALKRNAIRSGRTDDIAAAVLASL